MLPEESKSPDRLVPHTRVVGRLFAILSLVIFLFPLFLFVAFSPPADFPIKNIIAIPEGKTLSEVGELLEERGLIRSSFLFNNIVILLRAEKGVIAGDYYFKEPRSLYAVVRALTRGDFGLVAVRVTIPEGTPLSDTAVILGNAIGGFDTAQFLELASGKEGFLFPDTYFFLPNVTADNVVLTMEKNFYDKISYLEKDIQKSGRTLEEIVTMASLLEEEARTTDSRRIISGILWRRIAIGMPLQVDAVFSYINGKNTYELTTSDLTIDSPYNTYLYKGLPLGPISNPGLDSILAALNPVKTPYLYYLSDKEGVMHYGKNFEEHKRNRGLYLD